MRQDAAEAVGPGLEIGARQGADAAAICGAVDLNEIRQSVVLALSFSAGVIGAPKQ